MASTDSQPLNLTSCDAEPIQFIASIQDDGFLVSYSPDSLKAQNVSENISKFLGVPFQHAVGKALTEILPQEWVASQAVFLKNVNSKSHPKHLPVCQLSDGLRLDVYFYFSDGLGVLEFEPSQDHLSMTELPEQINQILAEIREAPDLQKAGKALTNGVRELTNLDRVMVYRFLPKVWHGEVLAESRVASVHSFDGLRFPAADIPKPARDLYLRNRIRYIYDARRSTSKLYPAKNLLTSRGFDLQDSRLRAVSPFHIEYLKNMGVTSSFSVAIIVDGYLWGLIACHHLSPLKLSHQMRTACEILSQAFAIRAKSEEELQQNRKRLRFESGLRQLVTEFRDQREPLKNFLKQHNEIRELFGANGIAVTMGGQIDLVGLTPTSGEIRDMARIVSDHMNKEGLQIFETTSLSQLDPKWEYLLPSACGLLAVPISKVPGELLMIFRPEEIQTLLWGGDPTKALHKREYPGPINPRVSFETWKETLRGLSKEWQEHELEGAVFIQNLIFETFVPRDRMIAELNEKLLRGK